MVIKHPICGCWRGTKKQGGVTKDYSLARVLFERIGENRGDYNSLTIRRRPQGWQAFCEHHWAIHDSKTSLLQPQHDDSGRSLRTREMGLQAETEEFRSRHWVCVPGGDFRSSVDQNGYELPPSGHGREAGR